MTRSMTIVVLAVGGLLTLGGCGLDSAATAPQEAASSATAAPSEGPSEVTTTKTVRQCDPNYSGACVPIAGDVDCAGGSGNGPAYVQGPVRVVGSDIYDLDRDRDGIGCED